MAPGEEDIDADVPEADDEEDYEEKKPAKKAKTAPKGKAAQSAGGKKGGEKSKSECCAASLHDTVQTCLMPSLRPHTPAGPPTTLCPPAAQICSLQVMKSMLTLQDLACGGLDLNRLCIVACACGAGS